MAKTNPKLQQYDRQLTALVTPELLGHRFARIKPGREYARLSPRGGDIHHLVSFQVGPATSSQAGQYTVELGLYYPAFARKMGQEILKPSIRHSHLNVRVRLGFLFPIQEDRWWRQLADEEAQAAQLRECGQPNRLPRPPLVRRHRHRRECPEVQHRQAAQTRQGLTHRC